MNRVELWLMRKALKRQLDRIERGQEGDGMKAAFDWVMRNKKGIAAFLGAVVAGMLSYSGANADQVHQWAGYVGYVVMYLGGAGVHASDDAKAVEQGLKEETKGGLVAK